MKAIINYIIYLPHPLDDRVKGMENLHRNLDEGICNTVEFMIFTVERKLIIGSNFYCLLVGVITNVRFT